MPLRVPSWVDHIGEWWGPFWLIVPRHTIQFLSDQICRDGGGGGGGIEYGHFSSIGIVHGGKYVLTCSTVNKDPDKRCHLNSVQKFRGIDSELFWFFRGKSVPFAESCVSHNSPFRGFGMEWNSTKNEVWRNSERNNSRSKASYHIKTIVSFEIKTIYLKSFLCPWLFQNEFPNVFSFA